MCDVSGRLWPQPVHQRQLLSDTHTRRAACQVVSTGNVRVAEILQEFSHRFVQKSVVLSGSSHTFSYIHLATNLRLSLLSNLLSSVIYNL